MTSTYNVCLGSSSYGLINTSPPGKEIELGYCKSLAYSLADSEGVIRSLLSSIMFNPFIDGRDMGLVSLRRKESTLSRFELVPLTLLGEPRVLLPIAEQNQ
jgi:hypothetical protein